MTLARERAISRAYLLSGDEDLREGVVAAQDMGVQVILIGIPTSQRSNQSAALVREADEHVVLPREHWATYFASAAESSTLLATFPVPTPTPETARALGRAFAAEWLSSATRDDVVNLLKDEPKIPGHLDLSLVVEGEKSMGSLRDQQPLKHELRAGFWAVVDESQSSGAD